MSLRTEIAALTSSLPSLRDPADEAALLSLLRCLYAIGRRDLPLGRLFEGHVDALQIVTRYAAPDVADRALAAAIAGAAFGVWNAELPGEALRLEDGRLSGGKAYASGAGILGHALVTADIAGGRQLVLLDLERTPPAIDRGWWRVVGMARSETHLVRWADAPASVDAIIGAPNDYSREPWFSGGALRFVAVQAGGVAALFDHVRDHLSAAGRAEDLIQLTRLSALFALGEQAAGAVRVAAGHAFGPDAHVYVASARAQIAELADRAIAVAQQAVGLQGLFVGHPLAAAVTDLMVYLRQPAPDAQVAKVGRAAAAGLIAPAL